MEVDFPTTDECTKEDIKKIQARLLTMAKTIAHILEDNRIPYFIAFGSLLGAVRHKGFIPWDDDFDFFLFDENYDAAIDCVRRNLPSDLMVQDKFSDPLYFPYWAKIRDKNTECVNQRYKGSNLYSYSGIGIDLFRLIKIKQKDLKLFLVKQNIEYLVRKHETGVYFPEYEEKFHKACLDYSKAWQICTPPGGSSEKDKEIYAFIIVINEIYHEEVFPLKKYAFEDTEFYGPNNYDAILKRCYGNYMEFPPFEERLPHYKKIIWK